ncbi:MAG: MFS transporter [Gammaproteobacteria bacterium]|nr:MFS transporter [Gammaproteobacteria bacterium]
MSQFSLLGQRRFAPLFLTQFLGAFNDNLYKNALVIFITFDAVRDASGRALLITASAGIFILPFFLFSGWAGQFADKLEKSRLIRRVKLAEILIMLLGAGAFLLENVPALIGVLFLMGSQSAFFGPLKYGILPQLLGSGELVSGNGLIQMATFVAILVGMILGGVLASGGDVMQVALTVVVVAILGWWTSRFVPAVDVADPSLEADRFPWRPMLRGISFARENAGVFAAVLGVSWFWFMGATFLQLLPAYGRDVLGGNADVVILLLTCFTVGIGIGSLLCARFSGRGINLGLVPAGALGMTLFALVPLLAAPDAPAAAADELASVAAVLAGPANRIIVGSFIGLAVCGGIFIVPLYTYVQANSRLAKRARVIAANNILNALFMVVSALLTLAGLAAGMPIPAVFAVAGIINLAFCAGVLRYLMRFESAKRAAASPRD